MFWNSVEIFAIRQLLCVGSVPYQSQFFSYRPRRYSHLFAGGIFTLHFIVSVLGREPLAISFAKIFNSLA